MATHYIGFVSDYIMRGHPLRGTITVGVKTKVRCHTRAKQSLWVLDLLRLEGHFRNSMCKNHVTLLEETARKSEREGARIRDGTGHLEKKGKKKIK